MADGKILFLDGFATMADEHPFKTITPQPVPTDPRIKELLGRALLKPETLMPAEVGRWLLRSSTICWHSAGCEARVPRRRSALGKPPKGCETTRPTSNDALG